MFSILLFVWLSLTGFATFTSSQSPNASLPRKGFQCKLPGGYSIVRNPGIGEFDQGQVYGAVLVAMLSLAYEDFDNLTDPISYPYPAVTLNITGVDVSAPYYRQFASYVPYHALQTMSADSDFTLSSFTLQNQDGATACKVVLAPPSAEWQQLIGGSTGGLSPRSPGSTLLPATLVTRQASSRIYNESSALEKLNSLYASDWYGPESTASDFLIALAAMIVKVSDISDKDAVINYHKLEELGYHLNVSKVPRPDGKPDYFANRGAVNLCAHPYGELSRRLGYGTKAVTNFETTLMWTNGTDLIQQQALRYEGPGRCR
ncbi:MAG: hypothetical protein Q9184_003210 [Pyrenodesmia sp. 2 TL-2023]